MSALLIIDSEPRHAGELAALAAGFELSATLAANLRQARELLAAGSYSLILLDPDLPDGCGLDLLVEDAIPAAADVVIMSRCDADDHAARCMRLGVDGYLHKPVSRAQLQARLGSLREDAAQEADSGRDEPAVKLLGESRPMRHLRRMLSRVAATEATVLLVGESGTGKELAALTLHQQSARREEPFVPVNGGAIPADLAESQLFGHEKGAFTGADKPHDGFFRQAAGGTLFLDEITEMEAGLQVKLLRALETGCVRPVGGKQEVPVDVRVIGATNRDPAEAVADGRLREDLYYRLNEFPVELPPLRNRGRDVLLLAEAFLAQLAEEHGRQVTLSDEARDCLRIHDWPGNVRELRNAMSRAFILADSRIEAVDLPSAILDPNEPGGDLLRVRVGETIAAAEKKLILATLAQNEGDRSRTARELGISVKTLYNRLKSYEEDASAQAPASQA